MLPPPSQFNPNLTNERISVIANVLLTEYYKTLDDLSSDTDDNYTRGCASFGRQKNAITALALAGSHPWLSLMNDSNDLVFSIGGVPCRFSSDDPFNPKKRAVLTSHPYQISFFDSIDTVQDAPCRYCFVIKRNQDEDSSATVFLIGYNPNDIAICLWKSDGVRAFYNANSVAIPEAIEIDKPTIKPKIQKHLAEYAENDR